MKLSAEGAGPVRERAAAFLLISIMLQASLLVGQTPGDLPMTVFGPASANPTDAMRPGHRADGLAKRLARSTANATSPPNIGDDSYHRSGNRILPLEIVPGGLFVIDRHDPESRSLHLTDFEAILDVAGLDYQYLGGAAGRHFLSLRSVADLWGLPDASGAPPIDHLAIFSEARSLIAKLADWSKASRSGRFLFSPAYRSLGSKDTVCLALSVPPLRVIFGSEVSLSRAEEILLTEIGGRTLEATDFPALDFRYHTVAVDEVTDGMALLGLTNRLATHTEVLSAASLAGWSTLPSGCGGPSGGGGGGPPAAAPVTAPSLGTLGLAALALLLSLLGVSTIRRSL